MIIDYLVYDKLPAKYHDGVIRLLILSDNEFVPPLSSRTSTIQYGFNANSSDSNVDHSISLYFNALLEQCFILSVAGDKVVGFLSYKKNHVYEGIKVSNINAYVSTICVDADYRRCGIANSFYETLEKLPHIPYVYTRTWGENHSHINLLKRRGYSLIHEITNDRASGISTVYYAKNLEK